MNGGTVPQHRATMLLNVGIAYVLGIIFIWAIKSILPKIKVVRQDNITQDGICLGRMEKREGYAHTNTHPRY